MTPDRSDPLGPYRRKRSPERTPEPVSVPAPAVGSTSGKSAPVGAGGRRLQFVVQQHAARRLHFDFRLELDGVLKSWAVPKGPSYDQQHKQLAVMVEDHPLEYAHFEGVIPKGNYGAGEVIVWDTGTWLPLEDPHAGLVKGKLLFELRGHRLRGRWTLVKIKKTETEWLLIKERDALEGPDRDGFTHDSVLSGRTLEELRSGTTRAAGIVARLRALGAPERPVHARDVTLMLASTRARAFDDPAWVFEFKYDGYRILAERAGGRVLLRSRNGHDLTDRFPDVARALAALPYEPFVLDGEVVVTDETGLPSFGRLQQRAQVRRAADAERLSQELPATYYAFDLPGFDRFDVRPLPLLERKALLRDMLPSAGTLRYSDHVPAHGTKLYALAEQMGLEGVVGKRADAPYRSGRSADWAKVRAHRTGDFVVVGLKRSSGAGGGFGSLHIACYRGGVLGYAGSVGTGLTQPVLDELRARLEPHRVPEGFPGAPRGRGDLWVEPVAVVEVRYLETTSAGSLRHPVFLRLRPDKDPSECVADVDEKGSQAATPGGPPGSGALDPGPVSLPVEPPSARAVKFTNLDKVFWPEDGYTKGDLVAYYRAIAPWLLPYLRDRPVVLTRFPDGIHGKSFYQKDAPGFAPEWLRRAVIWSEGSERELSYFIADDEPALLYLANSGTIPLHIWASRVGALERPDWCSLDLDPKDAPFRDVVKVALAVRALCEEIGMPCYPKTSGSTGLHVLLPLGGQCTHEQARLVGELIARVVVQREPEIATITRVIAQRQGRVYVDYLQNGHGKLLVAPFSVRPLPGAPVSTPLAWRDVNARLDLRKHTIRTVTKRMARSGDPLLPVLDARPDLLTALQALQRLLPR